MAAAAAAAAAAWLVWASVGWLAGRHGPAGGYQLSVSHSALAAICKGLSLGCRSTATSALGMLRDPTHLVVLLGLSAMAFAGLRALMAVCASRLRLRHFYLTPADLRSDKLDRCLAWARSASGLPMLPPVAICTQVRPQAFTAGLWRPKICLSAGLVTMLDEDELKAVVSHELAHVRRRDNRQILMMLALRDFLWALPVAHYLLKAFLRAKEHAADDLAVEMTGDRLALASAIVSVSKQGGGHAAPAYATFFPDRATAVSRVGRIVGRHPQRSGRLGLALVLTALVATLTYSGAAYAASAAATTSPNPSCTMRVKCASTADCCHPHRRS